MRKRPLLIACIIVTLVCVFATPAMAQFGATVIRDVGALVVGDDWSGEFALWTDNSQVVVTPAGTAKITCVFDIPDGYAPSQAKVCRGFLVKTPWGDTTDTQTVSTPGGKVILTCHIKRK